MEGIDRIILGHNQFIGVSHLSQDAARARVERFSDMDKVGEVVRTCLDCGVCGMMLSTHPGARDILDYLRREGLAEELNFYPLIPFAQGYVRKLNSVGLTGLVKEIFNMAPFSRKFDIAFQGGLGIARRDLTRLMGSFIDVELLPFEGLRIKAVFLHDAFVDLALALQAGSQLNFFDEHIRKRHHTRPAYVTMNFPLLIRLLNSYGIPKPLIMTTFNKVGFQMNPSKAECESCLGSGQADVVAMSTLAAGYLRPAEAFDYLFSLGEITSVVVGVSTPEHARETFEIIGSHLAKQRHGDVIEHANPHDR